MQVEKKYLYGGVVLLLAVIGLVIFLILQAPDQQENEEKAIASLRQIHQAVEDFSRVDKESGLQGLTLQILSEADPPYIDKGLGKGIKDGYVFMLLPLSRRHYICFATPLSEGRTGSRVFRITTSGKVEVDIGEGDEWKTVE